MSARAKTSRGGFTLVELLVVMVIIALLFTLALPSAIGLFTSGAEAQAYNVLSAQCMSARALAIQSSAYTAVHIQAAAAKPGKYYTAILMHDAASDKFRPVTGYPPVAMPAEVTVEDMTDKNNPSPIATIIFSPTGSVVRQVNAKNAEFEQSDKIFDSGGAPDVALWVFAVASVDSSGNPGRSGSTAVRLIQKDEPTEIIGINVYTGQLFPRR